MVRVLFLTETEGAPVLRIADFLSFPQKPSSLAPILRRKLVASSGAGFAGAGEGRHERKSLQVAGLASLLWSSLAVREQRMARDKCGRNSEHPRNAGRGGDHLSLCPGVVLERLGK